MEDDAVTWADWGWQTDYSDEIARESLDGLGDPRFTRAEHEAAIGRALQRLDSAYLPIGALDATWLARQAVSEMVRAVGGETMRPGRASRTAEQNALFRALETRVSERERVINDPFAKWFLSGAYRVIDLAARSGVVRGIVMRTIDQRWPGVRSSVVARTRLIDEIIAEQVGTLRQIVNLGAGFDTRPWRLSCLRDLASIFEVDHPDTQARKRAVVGRFDIDGPSVRFVPTDFRLDVLADAIANAGYSSAAPTLFLWEGTTNYLDEPAVDATLRWCAKAARGSRLIFTYINDDVLRDPTRYHGADRVFATLDRVNERMTFGMAPERMASYLAERGLALDSDLGAGDYRRKYYGERASTMHGHEFYRVATAHVAR